jgi:hypothetical protein
VLLCSGNACIGLFLHETVKLTNLL